MWVRAEDGDLINMNTVTNARIDGDRVSVWFVGGGDDTGGYPLTEQHDHKTLQSFMDNLWKKVNLL